MVACLLRTGGDCVTADDLKTHELLIKYIDLPKAPDFNMQAEWQPLPNHLSDTELGGIKWDVYSNFPGAVSIDMALNTAGQVFFKNQKKDFIYCYYDEQQKQIEVTGDVKQDGEMIGSWCSGNGERIFLSRGCHDNYSECVCLFTADILDGQPFDDFVEGMRIHQKILFDLYDFVEDCTNNRYFLQLQTPQYMYTTRLTSMEHSYLEAFLDYVMDCKMPTDSEFNWSKQLDGAMPFFQCMMEEFNWPKDCDQMKRSGMYNLAVTKSMYDEKLSYLPLKVQQIHKIFFEQCGCSPENLCKNCLFKNCVQSRWNRVAKTMPENVKATVQSRIEDLFVRQKFCQLPFWQYLLEQNGKDLSTEALRLVLSKYSNWDAFIWGVEGADKTQTVNLNENRKDP
jgi:hypothetical protein